MHQVQKNQHLQTRSSSAGNLTSHRSTQDVRFSSSGTEDSRTRSFSEGPKWFHKVPSIDVSSNSIETKNRFALLSSTTERYSPPHQVKKLEKQLESVEKQIQEASSIQTPVSSKTNSGNTSPKYIIPAKRDVNYLKQQRLELRRQCSDLKYDNEIRKNQVQMRKSSTP